jgi:hypothetical protein
MRARWLGVVAVSAVLLVGLLMAQVTVWAHHSFAAEFDAKKSATLTGTVASIKWTNPHAHIFVDVKDQAGNVTSWDFEMGSPNALMRRGWSRSSLKPGDTITVNGYLAKDGSRLANARTVTLSDGRNVFAGSSIESGQTQ